MAIAIENDEGDVLPELRDLDDAQLTHQLRRWIALSKLVAPPPEEERLPA